MTLTDRTIAAIRHTHDHLAEVASRLTDEELGRIGGASEWTVATTLSHLGSGQEINRYVLQRAVGDDSETRGN